MLITENDSIIINGSNQTSMDYYFHISWFNLIYLNETDA
jgi:hypothetical protein